MRYANNIEVYNHYNRAEFSSSVSKYVIFAALLGLFASSVPSQAQQAHPPASVTLQDVDINSGTGTGGGTGTGTGNGSNVENLPMLLQVPQVGLTGTKVEDLPLSVKVVPSKLIEQQGGTEVADALRDVSGASIGGADSHGFFDRFLIRGLDARVYEDGFSDGEQVNGLPHSMNGVQSVEILKGPGSALLGSGPPGGSVNITHFAPSSILGYGAGVQYGTFNTITSNYYGTGPTTISGLDFRVDGLVQHTDGFRELKGADYELRPVLTWRLDGGHVVTFAVDARHIERTPDPYGIIYFSGAPLNVSRDTKYSTPFDYANQNYIRTELSDVWTANSFLTINNRFSYMHRASQILRNGDSDTIVGAMMTGRTLRQQYDDVDDFDYQLEPVWKFHTGTIGHTLATGLEMQHQTLDSSAATAVLPNITNIFAPVIPETSASGLAFTRTGTRGWLDFLTADYLSVYATDQIDVTERFKLRFSARQNWWTTTLVPQVFVPGRIFEGNQQFEPGTNYSRADSPFDWSAGALYKVYEGNKFLPAVSPYAGVSRSHLANFSSEATSAAIQGPESALQYEVGVKVATIDNRYQLTFAAFDVMRQNVFTLVNDEPNFGNQFTRGLEMDFDFTPLLQWHIIGNGTLQQAKLTFNPSQPLAVGNVPIGVPLQMANLWTTYDFDIFGTKGFRAGAGLEYKGNVYGDQLNTEKVPSYVIFDTSLTYTQPNWDATVGVKNIGDTLYFTAANGAGAFVGDPRTFYVKANVHF